MSLGNFFDKSEADSASGDFLAIRLMNTIELLKDLRLVSLRYANAVIFYFNTQEAIAPVNVLR